MPPMAAEHRRDAAAADGASSSVTEERTEPFSPSELDARLANGPISVEGAVIPHDDRHVPLDVLQIEDHHHRQGIRILVRPLTNLAAGTRSVSPGSDSCQWVALRAEVASSEQPEHKVLAVTQTSKDIKFSVRIPGESQDQMPRPPLWCELYYDPASDKVIFLNKSDDPLSLKTVSQTPLGSPPSGGPDVINPGSTKGLRPGTWRIEVRGLAVLDFRVLEKRPVTLYHARRVLTHESSSLLSTDSNSSMKRALSPDADDKRAKRRMSNDTSQVGNGVVMFLRPSADPLVFPLPKGSDGRELSASNGHALLDAQQGETIAIPGVCEVNEYQLTKHEPIASTALSAVYKAKHSDLSDEIVTVKVLKTQVADPNDKPFLHERNVINQAHMWLRECQSQEDLKHDSIVRYYGGDARYLSLYMEHIDAPDLTAVDRWRSRRTERFMGTRKDAWRILRDIAGALSYIHGRQLVHNDIKPGNILYSTERGAVLCDFGLSTKAANPPSGGGTPYYVPPEFIGTKSRGPPSDVWALGITMLYVLGRITFPDSRGRRHPKPLYWLIAGINDPRAPFKQYGNGNSAVSQMREWLEEMYEAREGLLGSKDRLDRIVADMLTPNPQHRITMKGILREMH